MVPDQNDPELAALLDQLAALSAEVDQTQSKIAGLQAQLWRARRRVQARLRDPGLSDEERQRLQRWLEASQLKRLLEDSPGDPG